MGKTIESLGRRALRALGGALPASRGGVTVLAYHLVGGGTGGPVDLPLAVFRDHLDRLADSGRVVSLERALTSLECGAPGDHRIVITFDDAYRNFFEVAWPLLSERRLPATLYVPTGFVNGSAPAPLTGAESLPAMTWEQVRELAASDLGTVGSHSVTHPDLRRLPATACRDELADSKDILEQRGDTVVDSFCYPRALWSPRVKRQVAAIYGSAVAGGGRRNRPERFDRHRLFRLPLRSDMPTHLGALLEPRVWLEEWAASHARRLAS